MVSSFFVASFPSGFEEGSAPERNERERRQASAPEREVASNKVLFVVSSARGRTLPSGAALGYLGSVLGASGTCR